MTKLIRKTAIVFLFSIVSGLSLQAQDNSELDNFIISLNKILQDSNIPTIKNIYEDMSKYDDDFEYLKTLKKDFEPHERKKVDCETCYAFLIPKSSLLGYRCKVGNCINNDGILTIEKNKIYYIGNFDNALAHGSGMLYFVDKGFLKGNFYKGTLSRVEFIGTQGQSAVLESSLGMLSMAKQFYNKKYTAFYTGSINSNLQMTQSNYNNKLVSTDYDLTLRQNNKHEITSFFGVLKDSNGNTVEGNFDLNLKLTDGDIKIKTSNGDIITSTIYKGNIERYNVKIINGDDFYVGEVDEDFKPHGRGIMKKNGKEIPNERWVHGSAASAKRTNLTSNSSVLNKSIEKNSAKSNFLASIKQQCSSNWSKYIYCRTPKQNFVTTHTSGTKGALLINLSNQPIKIKVKQHFINYNSTYGFSNKWEKIKIPATKNFNDKNSIGKKMFKITYPYEIDTYEIEVKGDDADKVFWVISKIE